MRLIRRIAVTGSSQPGQAEANTMPSWFIHLLAFTCFYVKLAQWIIQRDIFDTLKHFDTLLQNNSKHICFLSIGLNTLAFK